MSRDQLGVVWAGLGLIGLGIAFLLAQWIGWEKIWPIFPVLGGLAFFAGYAASGFRDGGLAFVGTAATLIGLFFFGFTLGYWEWAEMVRLWPVFALIGGIAFVVLFIAQGRSRDWGVLGIGLAAIIVGVVALGVTHDLVAGDIIQYWPVRLLLMGFVGLVGALLRGFRRD